MNFFLSVGFFANSIISHIPRESNIESNSGMFSFLSNCNASMFVSSVPVEKRFE